MAIHRTGNLFKRGNVFWLRYMIDGTLIQQSLKTSDPQEAERKRQKIMAPLMAGSRADALAIVQARLADAKSEAEAAAEAQNPPLSMDDAWQAYEAATNRPDSSERTFAGYEQQFRKFRTWLSAEHPSIKLLRDVNSSIANAYAQQLSAEKKSGSTINQHLFLLRLVWRVLAESIRGKSNPWAGIQNKRVQKLQHRHKAITSEQFDNLLGAADSADLHDLLFVLAYTGQRLVDGVMLRWDAIDFKRKVVTLHPMKTARTGKAVHVPIMPPLLELFQKRRNMVGGQHVFPGLVSDYERDRSAISKRIQKAFQKAGLTPRENLPGVKRAVAFYGAHSLRHFFATQALSSGIPGEIVKRITGHTSDAMLEGYEHLDAALIGKLAANISNGKKPVAALPPPEDDLRAKVRQIADKMNGRNWKRVREKLRVLTDVNST